MHKQVLESEGHEDRRITKVDCKYCPQDTTIPAHARGDNYGCKGSMKSAAFDGLESQGVVKHTLDNISVCEMVFYEKKLSSVNIKKMVTTLIQYV